MSRSLESHLRTGSKPPGGQKLLDGALPGGRPGGRPKPDTFALMGSAARAWLGRAREWARSLEFTLARRFGIATREDRNFLILIGLIGVVAGLLGLATEYLIRGVQIVLWGSPGDLLAVARSGPRWRGVAAPAAGGALGG